MAHPRRFLTLCVPPPISHILLRVAQSAPAVYSAWLTVVRLRRRASFWKPPTVSKWIHHRLDLDLDLKFDVFRILITILKCFLVVTIRVKIVKRNDPLLFLIGSWIEDRIFMINLSIVVNYGNGNCMEGNLGGIKDSLINDIGEIVCLAALVINW